MKSWTKQKLGQIFFLSCCIVVFANDCPSPESILPCRCSLKGKEMQIWCSHSNLPQIMEGIRSVEKRVMRLIDELILENNQLPALPGRFFGSLKVMRLMLRHNNIERLSNGWLTELENGLVEIFLVERYLRSVPVESLNGLKNLEAVTIQSEELKRLPDFSGLMNLKYISIQSKSLLELPISLFKHLSKLQNIHINGGPNLSRLEAGLFENLPLLKTIDLSKNGISWIHLRSLYNLPSLTNLKLSQNDISDVGMVGRVIKDLENLQKLRLDQNHISILKEGSFVDLPKLRELYLNDNRITEIHYGAFHRTPNLRSVFLHNNLIKRIHPESFLQSSGSGVESLYLQNNEIDRVEELRSLLDALPTLKFLDFSNNFLVEIPFGSLRGHGTIEQLHIDNNLIQVIDRDALMAMPALRELRVRNNSLSETLQMPFWNLPGLKGLDLSLNRFKRIDSLLFAGLPSLRRLDLSQNSLAFIDPSTFIHTPMLETLNISFNEINTIHPATFRNLDRLFEIDASHNHLKDMIPGLPKIVERISLRENEISSLPISASKSFNLPNLRMLDISLNKLEHIPKFTFQSVNQLRVLSLSQNRLRAIEDSTFLGTSRLEMLYLNDNQIAQIQDRSFESMTDLRDLNLQGNKIERLTDNFFANNTELEQLDLSRNIIREIAPMTFKNLNSVQYLDLSGNLLINIPESLSQITTLKDIDLSFNRLAFLPPAVIAAWKNIIEIRLSNNHIVELKQGTVRNLPRLQYIDLSSNEINSIEPGALRNLPDLQELVLADNKLVELKDHVFENLSNLQAAHLQHNMLRFISPNSFFKSPSLVYFNLSSNNFRNMENIGLRSMRNLEVLDISGNNIITVNTMPLQALNWLVELKLDDNQICKIQGTPFETMPRLRVLSLKNNRMRSISEGPFKNLRGNIAVLDINGNPILCTCEMLWLSVWLEETNSPNPGPMCQNGKLLRASRVDKNECTDLRTSNQLPLINEHGDMFSRQISIDINDDCPDNNQDQGKERPLPGESEYFYDQYIDYPMNETNLPSNASVFIKGTSADENKRPVIKVNNTILNYNLHNKPRPTPQSSFTFFGYPLPSLNMGSLFGTGRRADARSKMGSTRGKVRMYRPTESEIEKYLNQETQFHDISSRNRHIEGNSGENISNEDDSSFRTPFKPPTIEKGGFLPILPDQIGGFRPIKDPFNNKGSSETFRDSKLEILNDSAFGNSAYNSMIPIETESSLRTSPKVPTTTKRYEISDSVEETSTVTPTTNYESVLTYFPSTESNTFQIRSTTTDPNSSENDTFLDDEYYALTSTPETILLIPPSDEQEKPVSFSNLWKSEKTLPEYSSLNATNQRSNTKPFLGRSTIEKVQHPQNLNLPTAEEYFRTTVDANTDNDVQPNEFVTTSYFQTEEPAKKNDMDWYYENYQNGGSNRDFITNGINERSGLPNRYPSLQYQYCMIIIILSSRLVF